MDLTTSQERRFTEAGVFKDIAKSGEEDIKSSRHASSHRQTVHSIGKVPRNEGCTLLL